MCDTTERYCDFTGRFLSMSNSRWRPLLDCCTLDRRFLRSVDRILGIYRVGLLYPFLFPEWRKPSKTIPAPKPSTVTTAIGSQSQLLLADSRTSLLSSCRAGPD